MIKKSVMMVILGLSIGLMSGTAMAGVIVFDNTTGFAGWTQISGAVPGSLSDGLGAVGLSGNTGFATFESLPSLLVLDSPSGANVGRIRVVAGLAGQTFPFEGSYVGVHYAAAPGETITDVAIPTTAFSVDTDIRVQITDASGAVMAETVRTLVGDVINLSATGLNTSAVDIRLINVAAGMWGAPFWQGNYVDFGTVSVTTAAVPEPASMSLLALGSLMFLKKKKWK